jgi:hypothetical protein
VVVRFRWSSVAAAAAPDRTDDVVDREMLRSTK